MLAVKVESYRAVSSCIADYNPFAIEHLTFSESPKQLHAKETSGRLGFRDWRRIQGRVPPLELYAFNKDRGEAIKEFLADFLIYTTIF